MSAENPQKDAQVRHHQTDSPVAILTRQRNANVVFSTRDQIDSINEMSESALAKDIWTFPNYTLEPEDVPTLVAIMKTAHGRTDRKQIIDRITIGEGQLMPQSIVLDRDTALHLPNLVPSLREKAEAAITTIEMPESTGSAQVHFVATLLKERIKENTPGKEYAERLLRKTSITDAITFRLYETLALAYEGETVMVGDFKPPKGVDKDVYWRRLIPTIEDLLPEFKLRLLRIAQEQFGQRTEDMSLTDMIAKKREFDDYIRERTDVMSAAWSKTHDSSITLYDIQALYKVLAKVKEDKTSSLDEQELATLRKLQIDPSLLPFSLAADKNDNAPSLKIASTNLFSGTAEKEKNFHTAVKRLPEHIATDAKQVAVYIIEEYIRNRTILNTLDIDALIARFTQQAETSEHPLMESDLLEGYVDVRFPLFAPFLKSKENVTMTIDPKEPYPRFSFQTILADRFKATEGSKQTELEVDGIAYHVDYPTGITIANPITITREDAEEKLEITDAHKPF